MWNDTHCHVFPSRHDQASECDHGRLLHDAAPLHPLQDAPDQLAAPLHQLEPLFKGLPSGFHGPSSGMSSSPIVPLARLSARKASPEPEECWPPGLRWSPAGLVVLGRTQGAITGLLAISTLVRAAEDSVGRSGLACFAPVSACGKEWNEAHIITVHDMDVQAIGSYTSMVLLGRGKGKRR